MNTYFHHKDTQRKDKLKLKNHLSTMFLLFIILCTMLVLYPQNISELFYYDDNPIRYMIAKKWIEGRLSTAEKKIFLAYGSAEIYLPFFYIAKAFRLKYETIYNISSLAIILVTLLYVFLIIPKEIKNLYILFPFFALFGIVCTAKGSLHWFLASSIILHVICTKDVKFHHHLLMGISYIISPPIIVLSAILFTIYLRRRDIKKASLLLSSLLFAIPKLILVSETTLEELKKSLNLTHYLGREIIGGTHSFAPPVPSAFLRPFVFDYIRSFFPLGIIVYVTSIRAVFTKDKFALVSFICFYMFAFISVLMFSLWVKGHSIPDLAISILSLIFISNPFRFVPIAISYLIINSENKDSDGFIGVIVTLSITLASFLAIIKREGELPNKIPSEIKSLISYLKNEKTKRILVEGDTHYIKNGKLIHPLYNSHIISYIVAEIDDKEFYGGIIPWQIYRYNFFAGKFNSKPIEKSDISSFIEENKIEMVICWTNSCRDFFSKNEIIDFGKLKVVRLKNETKIEGQKQENQLGPLKHLYSR